jgi:hypothetical protein
VLNVASTFSLVACTAPPGCVFCVVANTLFYSYYYKRHLRLYFYRPNSKLQAPCGFSTSTRWAD